MAPRTLVNPFYARVVYLTKYVKCFGSHTHKRIELSSAIQPSNWSWLNVRDKIITLPGRLGFPEGKQLNFLKISVDLNTGKIHDQIRGRELDEADHNQSFLIRTLYYILESYAKCQTVPLTGKPIAYRSLRGARFGDFYIIGAREKLLALLARGDTKLKEAVTLLEGKEVDFAYGDYAFKVDALPLIPITLVLTTGDDEFPADARIFYNESISNYLDFE